MAADEVGSRLGAVAAASNTAADVWYAWVGDHAADVDRFSREYLSSDERARLQLYRSRGAAERYVVTRSLVRIVLGDCFGIAPQDVRVNRTDTGKPFVEEDVHFNVTHSGELVLLALCRERPVGVDVERRRAVERVDALVRRWLTRDENEELVRLMARGHDRSDAFLRVWSLKEARLKALGVGISGASTSAHAEAEVLPLDDLLTHVKGNRAGADYVGAIAFA